MTTISLKLPEALAADLDHAAAAERKTRSDFFREALSEKLASARRRRKRSLYDLTKDLCGAGDSRMGDLSCNPKHMEGYGK